MNLEGTVIAVSTSPVHNFSKENQESVKLIKGLGIDGDAHKGEKTQHLYQVRNKPDQPNLRQVHLIHSELHAELEKEGFKILPGQMGENITTKGIDLLHLPVGTKLHLGPEAIVEVTGLRNPCYLLDKFKPHLKEACIGRDDEGKITERKSGIMSGVLEGGIVKPNDVIRVELPPKPYVTMSVV